MVKIEVRTSRVCLWRKMDSVKKAERGASPKQIKPHRYYLLAVH
ncbi:aspartate kinase [Bacillus subtilis]|nr:aspartate kinase [Bacillus subtilis]ASB61937.1 aspartate kinase [Bacillus sp. MD-5]AUZ39757.1 aspartate kinase [Bacillus sp. MBGLi79]AWX22634.1 aspartate kinase [Bacillus subtilis subsp. subtilis]AXC53881.1 aspartate kinase [Bacillus spizizenii]AXF34147.1 aspartate kinase [Bacillus sp. DM2]MDR4254531.1 aspartate kinase [Bacillus subtilis subsp. subtilis NCIB 3610 = ATCC 6051 = DSM 10]MDR4279096.1 aspartate kinase [Bacillus subtilis KCTC 1028 = ATCC 6051a]MUG02744.1 aspartate kinase [Baci